MEVSGGVDVFWRYSSQDAIYDPPGFIEVPVTTNRSRYLGTALDINVSWRYPAARALLSSSYVYYFLFSDNYVHSAGGGGVGFFSPPRFPCNSNGPRPFISRSPAGCEKRTCPGIRTHAGGIRRPITPRSRVAWVHFALSATGLGFKRYGSLTQSSRRRGPRRAFTDRRS